VLSVVVLLQQIQQQQQQKGTTQNTENTENRHQEPSNKQHPAVALPRVPVVEPERACAAGSSPPSFRDATDPLAVKGSTPVANPRTGSVRVP